MAKRRHVCVAVASGTVSFLYDGNQPENPPPNCATTNYLTLSTPDRDCNGGNGNGICSHGAGVIASAGFNFDAQGKVASTVTFTVTEQPDIVVEAETGYVH